MGRFAAVMFAPAMSMVAVWSLLGAGAPQEEQKRPVFGSSLPQEMHVDINFPATVYPRLRAFVVGGVTPLCITIQAMISRLGRWLHDPVFLLCLAAGLLAFVVQSGELGTADTTHRLQTTHWIWTSEPQVFPQEFSEFGIRGRGGRLYSWYGIGQSLLMLPADVVGTWIAHWQIFSDYGDDPGVRSIVVTYTTNVLVNVLTALIALRLLGQLGFSKKEAFAGVLALLFCTTHLHYTQNMMENNYILLLTLVGFSFQYEWLRTGSTRSLVLGSAALGLNLLTRLTTGLDLIACGAFVLFVLWFEQVRRRALWQRLLDYGRVAAPVYAFFALIDRVYQFYRFGSFTNTYVSLAAAAQRQQDPTLPPNYPWTTPFQEGFLGPLFKPEKSIFLFDPLLLLALLMLALLWKRLAPGVRAYALATLLLLLAYISFYARYFAWAGDFAWGDRYVSTTVELTALLAVPLLLRLRALVTENQPRGLKPTSSAEAKGTAEAAPFPLGPTANVGPSVLAASVAVTKSLVTPAVGKWIWRAGVALVAASLVIQIASLAFWLPLEIYQMETFGHPTFVIALRFKNIAAFALGKMDAWGLNTDAMTWDPWDYVHITTWNFLPFLLKRVGAAPAWVARVAFAVWLTAIAALVWTLAQLRSVVGSETA